MKCVEITSLCLINNIPGRTRCKTEFFNSFADVKSINVSTILRREALIASLLLKDVVIYA